MALLEGSFHFGRVIRTDARLATVVNLLLLYIYRATAPVMEAPSQLDHRSLLVPPIITNRQGWLRGYFKTVCQRPLEPKQVWPRHCFYSYVHKTYRDEYSRVLPWRREPCGVWGVASYSVIDYEMCKALGLDPSLDW
jgi:hypothetical protein